MGSVTTLLLAETKESERWIPHQNSKEHTKRLRERVGREMEKGRSPTQVSSKVSHAHLSQALPNQTFGCTLLLSQSQPKHKLTFQASHDIIS